MILAVDITDGCGLSNKVCCESLPKKSKVMLYLPFITRYKAFIQLLGTEICRNDMYRNGTVQLKCNLIHAGISQMFFTCCTCQLVHVQAYTHPQRITVIGNDVGTSPPSSVLHSLFIVHLLTTVEY